MHDVFSPALHTVARVIAEATLRLSDDELRVIIDGVPDVPNDVAQLRAVASDLIAGRPLDGLLRDEDLLRGIARWIAALSLKAPVGSASGSALGWIGRRTCSAQGTAPGITLARVHVNRLSGGHTG